MKTIMGKIDGSIVVEEDAQLFGVITENVTVLRGAHLHVEGVIMGDLVVHEGGASSVNGNVLGYIINDGGAVQVRGMETPLGSAGVLPPLRTRFARPSYWAAN